MDKLTLAAHVRALRDFFPRAEADGLRRLLPQSRFPSEELLREFLMQIGLPPLYAYLSYDYREDFGADELAENGIVPFLEFSLHATGALNVPSCASSSERQLQSWAWSSDARSASPENRGLAAR